MLNFDLMGKSGGFFFYTAYKDNVLLFIQAYSTTGQGHISEEERTRIIKAAHKATRRLSVLSLYEITDGHD
jgi:hypothetical protein